MTHLGNFLRFWYDFIVGDDWVVAAGVVIALAASALLAQRDVNAWWLMPVAVVVMLAARSGGKLGGRNNVPSLACGTIPGASIYSPESTHCKGCAFWRLRTEMRRTEAALRESDIKFLEVAKNIRDLF